MSLIWRKQTQPSEGDLEPSFELYDTINGLGILHVLIVMRDLPLRLVPWGFHSRAILAMSVFIMRRHLCTNTCI